MSQVVELFRRIRTMLKIFYFSGHHQFFHNSPGINFSYDRGSTFFIYWQGKHNLELGRHFQQNYQPGRPPGSIPPEHLDRVFRQRKVLVSLPYFLLQFNVIHLTYVVKCFSSNVIILITTKIM